MVRELGIFGQGLGQDHPGHAAALPGPTQGSATNGISSGGVLYMVVSKNGRLMSWNIPMKLDDVYGVSEIR